MESFEDLKSMYVKLVDTLNCSICQDTLNDARDLDCGHTYCLGCLQLLVATKGWKNTITCCLCKKKTAIPSSGLNDLKQNYKLLCIIDEQKSIMKKYATLAVQSAPASIEETVTLFVKNMEGKSLTFQVRLSDTARSLEVLVGKKTGIPTYQLWLLYRSKKLQGSKTLREFGVEANSLIHLMGITNGGGNGLL